MSVVGTVRTLARQQNTVEGNPRYTVILDLADGGTFSTSTYPDSQVATEIDNVAYRRVPHRFLTDSHGRIHGIEPVVLEPRVIRPGDVGWPGQIEQLGSDAPEQLWVLGNGDLARLTEHSVGIVGARAATVYGTSVASDLAHDLTRKHGQIVVSGGAFGIDAAAHRGALAFDGPTVAVLASGVDVPYPRAHQQLFEAITLAGLLVSEYPPGEHPTRQRFLERNRLIAALTQTTVVVEGTARSGSASTARHARYLGRPVGAVPGSIHSAQSVLPHSLIRSGEASMVLTAEDVVGLAAR